MTQNTATDLFDGLDLEGLTPPEAPAVPEKKAKKEEVKSSKNAVYSPQLAQSGLQKLAQIGKELNAELFEREAEIKSILLGLLTGKHVLLLGPPGTGKSYLAAGLNQHISNANYFQWLLNRTSDPSELLGPISVKAMEKDQFLRKPDGKLPEAHVAFLDEIFKSNSATLNVLLSGLNEGIWYNDGKAVPMNLKLAVGASNEFPEDEELDAFFDRFLFRHWVEYVGDAQNQAAMLKAGAARRAGLNKNAKTIITLEEIEAVQHYVNTQVIVTDAAINALQKVVFDLKQKDIRVSDRRLVTCVHIMQANAALEGRTTIDGDDLEHLPYVLWEKKEDIAEIEAIVTKLMNPFKDKLNKAYSEAVKCKQDIMNEMDKTVRANKAIDGRNVLERISKRIESVIKEASKEGRDVTEFKKKHAEVTAMMNEIVSVCLFNVDADNSADPNDLPF